MLVGRIDGNRGPRNAPPQIVDAAEFEAGTTDLAASEEYLAQVHRERRKDEMVENDGIASKGTWVDQKGFSQMIFFFNR